MSRAPHECHPTIRDAEQGCAWKGRQPRVRVIDAKVGGHSQPVKPIPELNSMLSGAVSVDHARAERDCTGTAPGDYSTTEPTLTQCF